MKSILLALALTLPLMAAQPAAAQDTSLAETYARPALAALSAAASQMEGRLGTLCEAPGEATLAKARDGFAELLGAWGRAYALRFGPLAAQGRFERIFFWPDPRGFTLRQAQQVLAAKDETATDLTTLAGKSVGIQGLTALEFLLYGDGSETLAAGGDGFRCRFAAAIAGNIASVASAVESEWQDGQPYPQALANPGPGTDLYRSQTEVDAELVKALVTALQFLRSAELVPPLGEDAAKANGRRAPFWRSNLTFAFIAAQVEGAQALYDATGFNPRLPDDMSWIGQSFAFELANARRMLEQAQQPAETAFSDEADRSRLNFASLAVENATKYIAQQLSAALGLTIGFNALDGD